MTYTREQIEALTAEVVRRSLGIVAKSNASAALTIQLAEMVIASGKLSLEGLDIVCPEPAPAPKENADEKRIFTPSGSGSCARCGEHWTFHIHERFCPR